MERKVSLVYALVLVIAIGILSAWSLKPPAPRGVDAPDNVFSALRAISHVKTLIPEGKPHPNGSTENELVRERVLSSFVSLGIEPRVETEITCNTLDAHSAFGRCAQVSNIIAPITSGSGKPIILMSHYDSVGAGPGAGDASHGVATILEIARILKEEGPFENPIMALITDGEEDGLLGAHAYFSDPQKAAAAGIVINLEARGSAGPSFLFETSDDAAWLIDLYAKNADRPLTNSLMLTAYKTLPNDTDMSESLAAGVAGINFAFASEIVHYHTPLDNVENLNPASVQHQGDNMLAMVRALADADLANAPKGDALYMDVLSRIVMRVPMEWAMPLVLLALALVAYTGYAFSKGAERRWSAVVGGVFFVPLLVLCAVAGGFLMNLLAGLFGAQQFGYANPVWLRCALYLGAAFGMFALSISYGRWLGVRIATMSVWTAFIALTIVLLFVAPGAAVIFLFPVVFASILMAISIYRSEKKLVSSATFFMAAGFLLLLDWPLVSLLEILLTLAGHFVITAVFAFATMGLVPVIVAWSAAPVGEEKVAKMTLWKPAFALAGVAVLFSVTAGLVPAYDKQSPMTMNIVHMTDERSEAVVDGSVWRTWAREIPSEIKEVATFSDEPTGAVLGLLFDDYIAPAPASSMESAVAHIVSDVTNDGVRQVRVSIDVPDEVMYVRLLVPENARPFGYEIIGEGIEKSFAKDKAPNGYYFFNCARRTCKDVVFSLPPLTGEAGKEPWILYSERAGLPESGAALIAARPNWVTTRQSGDLTVVIKDVVFE